MAAVLVLTGPPAAGRGATLVLTAAGSADLPVYALVALVQSLARLILEEEWTGRGIEPEVLAENRFLAARDGLGAQLIDPAIRRRVPLRVLLDATLERCRPHAAALGCLTEFDRLALLAAGNGADRQRAVADEKDLRGLVSVLSAQFSAERSD